MTITINHPQSGGFLNKNRLAGAALAAAALLTVGLYTQFTGNDPARSTPGDPVVETVEPHADYDHFVSLNEIPWAPLTSVPATTTVDRRAELQRELETIRAGTHRTAPPLDQQAVLHAELEAIRAGADSRALTVDSQRVELLSMNEIPWAPRAIAPATTGTTDPELAFFLSLNGVAEPTATSASSADGDRAFFLSINGVEE